MKLIAAVFTAGLSVTSSLALAGVSKDLDVKHNYATAEGKQALKELVKVGNVLSVAPKEGQNIVGQSNGQVQPYVIRIRTKDGVVHSVEYCGTPVGVNNG